MTNYLRSGQIASRGPPEWPPADLGSRLIADPRQYYANRGPISVGSGTITTQTPGSGSKVLKIEPFTLPAATSFDCSTDALGNALSVVDSNGKAHKLSLVSGASTRGVPLAGTWLVHAEGSQTETPFVGYQIDCQTTWTLRQVPATDAPMVEPGTPLSGTGAAVVQVANLDSGLSPVKVAATGNGNLMISTFDASGNRTGDSLVNAVIEGSYIGEFVVPQGSSTIYLDGVSPGTSGELTMPQ